LSSSLSNQKSRLTFFEPVKKHQRKRTKSRTIRRADAARMGEKAVHDLAEALFIP
jgi:hypothetical protein